jgi:Domain of unknown function (DUF4357)
MAYSVPPGTRGDDRTRDERSAGTGLKAKSWALGQECGQGGQETPPMLNTSESHPTVGTQRIWASCRPRADPLSIVVKRSTISTSCVNETTFRSRRAHALQSENSMNGKTIRIYLADGVPSGILTAEIINWTGKVIVAPRSQLAQLASRQEAKRTGVYLLVGPDPESPSRDLVYIGEGDNVLTRLLKHNNDERMDFWSRTVLIISKDDNLTKAHIRHLESELLSLARQANRARLVNGTEPEPPPLPESDRADMHFFLSQVQMILPVLGFTFTQQLPVVQAQSGRVSASSASPIFIMSPVGTHATAQEIDGEFIVRKGSTARKQGVESWESYRGLREQLLQERKLQDAGQDGLLVFTEDVPFSSPSAAAAVVYGGNQNGRTTWKLRDTGQTYQQWQEQKLAAASGETGEGENQAGGP